MPQVIVATRPQGGSHDRGMRGMGRRTYGEVWGRGPSGLTIDIADEGFVDVARADEAIAQRVRKALPSVGAWNLPLINVCWR